MGKTVAKSSRKSLGALLGRNIAELRKAHGMTQNEFAEALGVEPITVSRFERGVHLPTLHRLEQIANMLGVSVGGLLTESSPLGSDQASAMEGWLVGLSDEDRRFVSDMVKLWCDHLRVSAQSNKTHF